MLTSVASVIPATVSGTELAFDGVVAEDTLEVATPALDRANAQHSATVYTVARYGGSIADAWDRGRHQAARWG